MRAALFVILVLGCKGERKPVAELRPDEVAAPSTPTSSTATRARCLAERVGELAPEWGERDDCTRDNKVCLEGCALGDASACFVQALFYQEAERHDDAQRMFERACLAGLSLGCVNYGAGIWTSATSTKADLDCASRLFARSCDARDSMGCMMVARMMIENSDSPDRDGAKAFLERKCAEMKGPPCRVLAYYLERGELGAPDASRSKALLRLACEGRDEDACGDPASAAATFRAAE